MITVSTGNLAMTEGSAGSFTVTASNAAGRIDITSSDASVARVSTTSAFLDNSSVTVTVTGAKAGTATITIRATDMTTYDDEDITGMTRTVTVRVNETAPAKEETPAGGNTNGGGSANGGGNAGAQTLQNSQATRTQSNVGGNTQSNAQAQNNEPIPVEEVMEIVEENEDEADDGMLEPMEVLGVASENMGNDGAEYDPTIGTAVVACLEFVIIVAMLLGFCIWHRGRRRSETCQTTPQPETLLPPKA
ncbi:hypothetical protein IJH06_01745 [Candidatus Saccharibacteria bacterium]|nr:hypothetical protein [Candidatus Saccharibacteria bacterium]